MNKVIKRIFAEQILKNEIKSFKQDNPTELEEKWKIFENNFLKKRYQEVVENEYNEKTYDGDFIDELFCQVLGYQKKHKIGGGGS